MIDEEDRKKPDMRAQLAKSREDWLCGAHGALEDGRPVNDGLDRGSTLSLGGQQAA